MSLPLSRDRAELPVVVIGAGPVGLAAAAHLVDRGLEPLVFEAGTVAGASVREWGHVRVFSPWRSTSTRSAPACSSAPAGSTLIRTATRRAPRSPAATWSRSSRFRRSPRRAGGRAGRRPCSRAPRASRARRSSLWRRPALVPAGMAQRCPARPSVATRRRASRMATRRSQANAVERSGWRRRNSFAWLQRRPRCRRRAMDGGMDRRVDGAVVGVEDHGFVAAQQPDAPRDGEPRLSPRIVG